jgi:hypothetical protein
VIRLIHFSLRLGKRKKHAKFNKKQRRYILIYFITFSQPIKLKGKIPRIKIGPLASHEVHTSFIQSLTLFNLLCRIHQMLLTTSPVSTKICHFWVWVWFFFFFRKKMKQKSTMDSFFKKQCQKHRYYHLRRNLLVSSRG